MAKRKAVGFLMTEKGFSPRRACRIVGLARSVQQYRPKPKTDVALVTRMKALAAENRKRRLSAPARHAAQRRARPEPILLKNNGLRAQNVGD
ncbi:hypothetical protein [Rhodovulum sulfidophilum]|uniref:hypothetical protein n=1 Tax=Rhodovulum sulfidophilum TaxID=35806 RepID=UPI0019229122|nr:hypothetical protein [Rhodovulum sulfidophilum]MBL3562914.1 hypothetical protein [Rhodovulum sulfidophilum]